MSVETNIVYIIAAIIGAVLGWFYYYLKNAPDKRMQKIIKNPRLLIKELKKQGKFIEGDRDDIKEEIKYELEEDPVSGEKKMVMKKIPVNPDYKINRLKKKKKKHKIIKPSKHNLRREELGVN